MSRRLILASLVLLIGSARSALGGPTASFPPPTLRQQAAESRFVLFGTIANPAMNSAGGVGTGVTDLRIELVIKPGAGLPKGKVVTLPRYIPIEGKKPNRFIVFFDVFQGQLDPWAGSPVESDAAAKYLRDALKLDPTKSGDAVLFFNRHVDSPDPVVKKDALRELSSMKYAELREGAGRLDPDVLAERRAKEDRPLQQRMLDALLLGHCGQERHAELLKKSIDAARKEHVFELGELLISYALLKPREGLAVIREVIEQMKAPFEVRYSALRALQFFSVNRPEICPRGRQVQLISLMLDQPDMVDLAVEELRKLGEESVMERVLALPVREGFVHPGVGRAVLRYALTFPKNAKARAHIEQCRAADPFAVESAEGVLKLEADALKKGE
jgi:hypothetical protein